jgi:hypothetical protein
MPAGSQRSLSPAPELPAQSGTMALMVQVVVLHSAYGLGEAEAGAAARLREAAGGSRVSKSGPVKVTPRISTDIVVPSALIVIASQPRESAQ